MPSVAFFPGGKAPQPLSRPRSNRMSQSPSSGVGPLAAAARHYQSLGLSVLPWKYDEKKGKKPLRRWDVAQHPSMTADEVASWWRMYPDHNVGVITGPTGPDGQARDTDIVVICLRKNVYLY